MVSSLGGGSGTGPTPSALLEEKENISNPSMGPEGCAVFPHLYFIPHKEKIDQQLEYQHKTTNKTDC